MATNDEGMSTSKKVVAGAALGVAIPAAVGAAKKLMGNGDDSDGRQRSTQRRKTSATRSAASRSRSTTKAGTAKRTTAKRTTAKRTTAKRTTAKRGTAKRTTAKRTTATRSAATPTREQLYRQATRLKIDGRSSMTKAELQRAVNRAKSRTRSRS